MKNFLTFFFIIFVSSVFAQFTEFSSVSSEFPDQVEDFIKEYDKALAKEYAKDLEDVWEVYPETQKQIVISIANKMLEKKVKLRPHFLHYFSSIASFGSSSNYSSQGFENWTKVVFQTIGGQKQKKI